MTDYALQTLRTCLTNVPDLDQIGVEELERCLKGLIQENLDYWAPEARDVKCLKCVYDCLCSHSLTKGRPDLMLRWNAIICQKRWHSFINSNQSLGPDPLLTYALHRFEKHPLAQKVIKDVRKSGWLFLCESQLVVIQSPVHGYVVRSDGLMTERSVECMDFDNVRWKATQEDSQKNPNFQVGDWIAKSILCVFVQP